MSANSSGRWQAAVCRRAPAGGPYSIEVTGAERHRDRRTTSRSATSGSARASPTWNIRFAGRSTATARCSRATDPDLRLMKVPQQLSNSAADRLRQAARSGNARPRTAHATSPPPATSWRATSARPQKVPIGAIDDSWGGTPIRAWMSEAAVARQRRSRGRRPARRLPHRRTRRGRRQLRRRLGQMVAIEDRRQARAPSRGTPAIALAWKPVPVTRHTGMTGAADWQTFDRRRLGARAGDADRRRSRAAGDALARRRSTTWTRPSSTASPSAAAATRVDRATTRSPGRAPRPAPTRSWSYVRNAWGPGGFDRTGQRSSQLAFADGHAQAARRAAGNIRASTTRSASRPCRRGAGSSGVSTIYNAMVAPLGPLRPQGRRLVPGRSRRRPAGLRPAPRRVDGELAHAVPRSASCPS